LTELDYEELAKQVAKLYAEKPELAFKLFDWLRKYFATSDDLKQYIAQSRGQFQELLQEINKRFEENRAETNKRFEEINKRFEENRAETNKQFQEMIERFEESRAETNKRFEESRAETNKRFEESRAETNKRFEETLKRYEENRVETNKRFEVLDMRLEIMTSFMDRRFKELALGYGGTFEGFNKTILKKILAARGIPIKAFNESPLHFQDPDRIVHPHTTDVEINIFNEKPPIIGEVTSSLVRLDDLNTFIRKIQFIEKKFNKKFQRFFITLFIDDKIKEPCQILLTKYAIEVATLE